MNGIVHRSNLSLRLDDVTSEVRRGLWKRFLGGFLITILVFVTAMAVTYYAG